MMVQFELSIINQCWKTFPIYFSLNSRHIHPVQIPMDSRMFSDNSIRLSSQMIQLKYLSLMWWNILSWIKNNYHALVYLRELFIISVSKLFVFEREYQRTQRKLSTILISNFRVKPQPSFTTDYMDVYVQRSTLCTFSTKISF